MYGRLMAALPILTACAAAASAGGVQFQMLGEFYASSVSADGAVIVGNSADGNFETVRWTQGSGLDFLGRATVPVLGSGAGIPDVSFDGTRISSTILSDDGTFQTQGVWTEGGGWRTINAYPSDAGIVDSALSSAWGITGDGKQVAGLYWRNGQSDGLAHASIGSVFAGATDLGSSGGSSRANAANYDGSVVVGWDEDANDGHWRSVVWVDGVRTILHDLGAFTEATAVNGAGDIVVGDAWNPDTATLEAAAWRWNGASWDQEILGVLPGTFPGFGRAVASGVSGDGSVIVGYNSFDFGPFGGATGFIWTADDGMMSVEDFLAAHGVAVDPAFDFGSVTAVSEDGRTFVGYGTDWNTFEVQSFSITIPAPGTLVAAGLGAAMVHRRRRTR